MNDIMDILEIIFRLEVSNNITTTNENEIIVMLSDGNKVKITSKKVA